MSLLRLLAAGKSLMGLKDPRGRFEVTEKRLLPKFEAAKNPFRATTLPHGKPEDREPLPPAEPEVMPADAAKSPTAEAVTNPTPRTARARSLWERAGDKCRGTWPFGAGAKKQEVRTVQPELSLELVRVVRNDLSDSDGQEKPKKAEGPAIRTLGADAVRAIEKSARDLLHACKL